MLVAVFVAVSISGIAGSGWAASPKMKMTTDMPPGIASPDKVETRLGTLNFFDGFPDDATGRKLYDNLDFQRAVQAYLLAIPGREPGGKPERDPQTGPGQHDGADLREPDGLEVDLPDSQYADSL